MENYYTHPAISASGLKLIARSPAHYKHGGQAATEAMKFGTMAHCAILETHDFDNRYTVVPEGVNIATKEGKEIKAMIIASGKEPVKHEAMLDIYGLQKAVHEHRQYQRIMDCRPKFEQEFYLTRDGLAVKMKCDIVIEPCAEFPAGLVYDLKSVPDASPDRFFKSMWNGLGFIQPAWYCDLFMRHYGTTEQPEFWWQPVEKKPPYLTAAYRCSPEQLDYGSRQVDKLLDIYMECSASGIWPGYDEAVTDLVTPDWALAAMTETTIEFISEEEKENA